MLERSGDPEIELAVCVLPPSPRPDCDLQEARSNYGSEIRGALTYVDPELPEELVRAVIQRWGKMPTFLW